MTNSAEERHICTKEDPYDWKKHGKALHPDAKSIEEHYGGVGDNYEAYKCPWCGTYFEVELSDG